MANLCAVDSALTELASEITMAIAARPLVRGVILLTCGTHGNVIRLLLPLVIGGELLRALEAIIRSLEQS